MSTKLPTPPPVYDVNDQSNTRRLIETGLAGCLQSSQDVVLGPGLGIVLRDPQGRSWRLTMGSNGNLVATGL